MLCNKEYIGLYDKIRSGLLRFVFYNNTGGMDS